MEAYYKQETEYELFNKQKTWRNKWSNLVVANEGKKEHGTWNKIQGLAISSYWGQKQIGVRKIRFNSEVKT